MSRRGTAEILALAVFLVPSAVVAGDLDYIRGKESPIPALPLAGPVPSVLKLAWLDVSQVAVGVDGVARSEVGSIFEKAGLDVSWRRGRGGEQGRPEEIRIVLVDRLLVDRTGRPVLGATPTRPRRHPLVWIHLRSVRAALGLPLDPANHQLPVIARRNLGVALGRVIAHEIIHALVPALDHGGELMADSLRRRHLTAPQLTVAPAVAVAVRQAFDGLQSPPRDEAGVLAASGRSQAAVPGFTPETDPAASSGAGRDLAR